MADGQTAASPIPGLDMNAINSMLGSMNLPNLAGMLNGINFNQLMPLMPTVMKMLGGGFGNPGGNPGASPLGGFSGSNPGASPFGGFSGGNPGTSPLGGLFGGNPGASPLGGLLGGIPGASLLSGLFGGNRGASPYGGFSGGNPGYNNYGYNPGYNYGRPAANPGFLGANPGGAAPPPFVVPPHLQNDPKFMILNAVRPLIPQDKAYIVDQIGRLLVLYITITAFLPKKAPVVAPAATAAAAPEPGPVEPSTVPALPAGT